MRTHWLKTVLVLMVGCAGEETLIVEQEAGSGTPCPPWMCLNSPNLTEYNLHELNLKGRPTDDGLSLEASDGHAIIVFGQEKYRLEVIGNAFVAFGQNGDKRMGQGLVGGELHVLRNEQPALVVKILAVDASTFPVGAADPIEMYRMRWYHSGNMTGGGENVCDPNVPSDAKTDLPGMDRSQTLIFVGDRIDRHALTIKADPSNEWVNFACGLQTLSKLHLTRNTTSSGLAWENSKHHQATLKLLAGDFCGKGVPITVAGTPLRWKGGSLEKYASPPDKIEARWTAEGATCLNDMRLDYHPSLAFPDPHKVLDQTCQLPNCYGDIDDLDGALRISGNVY